MLSPSAKVACVKPSVRIDRRRAIAPHNDATCCLHEDLADAIIPPLTLLHSISRCTCLKAHLHTWQRHAITSDAAWDLRHAVTI